MEFTVDTSSATDVPEGVRQGKDAVGQLIGLLVNSTLSWMMENVRATDNVGEIVFDFPVLSENLPDRVSGDIRKILQNLFDGAINMKPTYLSIEDVSPQTSRMVESGALPRDMFDAPFPNTCSIVSEAFTQFLGVFSELETKLTADKEKKTAEVPVLMPDLSSETKPKELSVEQIEELISRFRERFILNRCQLERGTLTFEHIEEILRTNLDLASSIHEAELKLGSEFHPIHVDDKIVFDDLALRLDIPKEIAFLRDIPRDRQEAAIKFLHQQYKNAIPEDAFRRSPDDEGKGPNVWEAHLIEILLDMKFIPEKDYRSMQETLPLEQQLDGITWLEPSEKWFSPCGNLYKGDVVVEDRNPNYRTEFRGVRLRAEVLKIERQYWKGIAFEAHPPIETTSHPQNRYLHIAHAIIDNPLRIGAILMGLDRPIAPDELYVIAETITTFASRLDTLPEANGDALRLAAARIAHMAIREDTEPSDDFGVKLTRVIRALQHIADAKQFAVFQEALCDIQPSLIPDNTLLIGAENRSLEDIRESASYALKEVWKLEKPLKPSFSFLAAIYKLLPSILKKFLKADSPTSVQETPEDVNSTAELLGDIAHFHATMLANNAARMTAELHAKMLQSVTSAPKDDFEYALLTSNMLHFAAQGGLYDQVLLEFLQADLERIKRSDMGTRQVGIMVDFVLSALKAKAAYEAR